MLKALIATVTLLACVYGAAQNGTPAATGVSALRARAETGDAEAQNHMALAYRMDKDFTESMKWYAKAAKQGNANAMFNLGTFYYNGDGVPVDDVAACAWFTVAQIAGSSPAGEAVKRSGSELSPRLLALARLQAADMLAEGTQVPRNLDAAAAQYDAVDDKADADIQVRVAKAFLTGEKFSVDPQKAESHCKTAARNADYFPAMLCLGFLYESGAVGTGRGKDANYWYEKAAKFGTPLAAYGLGVLYIRGDGVKQDLAKGMTYMALAEYSGLREAHPIVEALEQKLGRANGIKLRQKAVNMARAGFYNGQRLSQNDFLIVVKLDHVP